MGQSKGGGFQQLPTTTPQQQTLLDFLSNQAPGAFGQAQSIYSQFLPGGSGADALKQQALQTYKQEFIPAALNAFGTDNKGSSGLNQALAAGAAGLNTNLQAQIAQQQLAAAQGLSGIGANAGQLGLSQAFAYQPKPVPFWQQLLLGGLGAGGQLGAGFLGRPTVQSFTQPNA